MAFPVLLAVARRGYLIGEPWNAYFLAAWHKNQETSRSHTLRASCSFQWFLVAGRLFRWGTTSIVRGCRRTDTCANSQGSLCPLRGSGYSCSLFPVPCSLFPRSPVPSSLFPLPSSLVLLLPTAYSLLPRPPTPYCLLPTPTLSYSLLPTHQTPINRMISRLSSMNRVSPPVKAMVSSSIMHTSWPPHSGTAWVMFSSRA